MGDREGAADRENAATGSVGGIWFLVCLLQVFFFCGTALASAAPVAVKEDSWTFSLYFENDLFANTDQSYTNGTKLSWISPDLTAYARSDKLPPWSLRYVKLLPFINEPGLKRNIALSFGQKMYTPGDISRVDLIEDNQPYAGWTYGGIAFHSKNSQRLDSMEIQLGMVGPFSFAEQTQNLVHELRNIPTAKGWKNQLDNEPGLAIIYERKWRMWQMGEPAGFGFDAITHLGAALGNVYTYANGGLEVRCGWRIPADFGVSLIRPAGDTNAPLDRRDPRLAGAGLLSAHLFGMLDSRVVLRNIFLDGNTFADSHSVDKNNYVTDLAAGVSIIIWQFKISYGQVLRSKEFKGQEKNHSFGSITVSFSY